VIRSYVQEDTMRKITAEMLAEKGACPDQLDRFRERFPDGVDPETVRLEEVYDLDVRWAVRSLLPAPARKAFVEATAPARETHKEGTAPAWKAYWEARASAVEAYMGARANAAAWRTDTEARDAAWKAYEEVTAPAWKALNKVKGPAREALSEATARIAIELFREYWR